MIGTLWHHYGRSLYLVVGTRKNDAVPCMWELLNLVNGNMTYACDNNEGGLTIPITGSIYLIRYEP